MKKKTVVLILMLAATIICLIALSSVCKSVKIKKLGVTAESTVLESLRRGNKGGSLRTVTVSFNTPDGRQYTGKSTTRKIVFKGDKVTIWYDPAFPQKIDFGDTISYNMRGVIIGLLLFVFGLYYFIRYSWEDKSNSKLISSGMKIAAEFVSVDRDESFRAGDKNPWIIKCKWVNSRNNMEYYFNSKEYTIDPVLYLNGRNHIDVFIDPDDPNKYYMDTSFMPEGNNTIG